MEGKPIITVIRPSSTCLRHFTFVKEDFRIHLGSLSCLHQQVYDKVYILVADSFIVFAAFIKISEIAMLCYFESLAHFTLRLEERPPTLCERESLFQPSALITYRFSYYTHLIKTLFPNVIN